MAYWKPLIVDGIEYDLSHLEPFEFLMIPKGWKNTATISVRFNDHCFTEKYIDGVHNSRVVTEYSSRFEERGFSNERYLLSFKLREIIINLKSKRISRTREQNLVYSELEDGNLIGIFFTIRKAGGRRCEMFVVSAYPIDDPSKRISFSGRMKYDVAVALVLEGKPVKFPNR